LSSEVTEYSKFKNVIKFKSNTIVTVTITFKCASFIAFLVGAFRYLYTGSKIVGGIIGVLLALLIVSVAYDCYTVFSTVNVSAESNVINHRLVIDISVHVSGGKFYTLDRFNVSVDLRRDGFDGPLLDSDHESIQIHPGESKEISLRLEIPVRLIAGVDRLYLTIVFKVPLAYGMYKVFAISAVFHSEVMLHE